MTDWTRREVLKTGLAVSAGAFTTSTVFGASAVPVAGGDSPALQTGSALLQASRKSEGFPEKIDLNSGWHLRCARDVAHSGKLLSCKEYDASGWMPAQVPGTVLMSYVKNGVYKDPYYDVYNKLSAGNIPDAGIPESVFAHAHWYRTGFTLKPDYTGKVIWLNLDGINFAGDIYLNGQFVGQTKGAFKRNQFDITAQAHIGPNTLAVYVQQVETPCNPSGGMHSEEFRRYGRNGPTFLTSIGYDFVPQDGIRDRNMGIFRDIYVTASGPVVIRNHFLITDSVVEDKAELTFKTHLINGNTTAVTGNLRLLIDESIRLSCLITLQAGETREVVFHSRDHPGLVIYNPRLWWPINKGNQELYKLAVSFISADGVVSDEQVIHAGIRDIRTDLWHGQLRFWVNGKKVFINGGNWVQDSMLRTTRKDYEVKIRQMAQAGINMLRIWSGSGPECDYFFDLCDRYGIMTWVESGLIVQMDRPEDTALFLENWKDVILRVRRHASVAYYCGCNEGKAGIPAVGEFVSQYDGTRGYIDSSQDCGQRGNPYGYHGVDFLYDYTPVDFGAGPLGPMAGFCNESGQITLPPAEVLNEMIAEHKLWPVTDNFALEEVFRYHGNGYGHLEFLKEGCAAYGRFDSPDLANRVNVDNYAFKGQMLGAAVFRGLCETWKRNKWDEIHKRFATGYMLWTANEAEPVTAGRLASYTGEPNAALYYVAHANKPLHAQFDYYYNDVSIANDDYLAHGGLKLVVEVRGLQWELLWKKSSIFDVDEDAVLNGAISVPDKNTEGFSDVHFIYVELWDEAANRLVDTMIYWRSREGRKYGADGPFTALNKMPRVYLKVQCKESGDFERRIVTARLSNQSEYLALFIRLKIYRGDSQKLIQPVHYSDNYFSIPPGQSKTVTMEYYKEDVCGEKPELITEGWNVPVRWQEIVYCS